MKTTSLQTPLRRSRTTKHLSASIFSEIRREHETFRAAMKKIDRLYDQDAEAAKEAYAEFRIRLQAHARAEEESLYQALLAKTRPLEKLDNEIREGKEEHHLGDLLVNELTQIPAVDPKWKAKFKVLSETTEHHLDEEEEYFPHWKKHLSRTEEAAVLERFVARRAAVTEEIAAGHTPVQH
jgi:hemerythrin superfamily protein